MKISTSCVCLFLLLIAAPGWPQGQSQTAPQTQTQPQEPPPSTDIYVADLSFHNGAPVLGKPVNVTNRPGYDNQPFFLPDGKSFLFTSIRTGDQADLYRHDLQSHHDTQITNTPESEFSPTLMPDGKSISTVRVEADQTQRLWMFPLNGGNPQLVLKDIKPVGYHVWIDSKTLGLFILGEPDTLQIADTETGTAKTVASKIGRCMKKIPGTGEMSFVSKESEKVWMIERYDPKTGQITPILETLEGSEDYAWTSAGILLMAQDAKFYFANPKKGSTWTQFADVSSSGAKNITRIDITTKDDKIAFVAQ